MPPCEADKQLTKYMGTSPASCSVTDSRAGSFAPRSSEMSSAVERFRQLPIVGIYAPGGSAAPVSRGGDGTKHTRTGPVEIVYLRLRHALSEANYANRFRLIVMDGACACDVCVISVCCGEGSVCRWRCLYTHTRTLAHLHSACKQQHKRRRGVHGTASMQRAHSSRN